MQTNANNSIFLLLFFFLWEDGGGDPRDGQTTGNIVEGVRVKKSLGTTDVVNSVRGDRL